jgi:BirA family biotin operon repressor/biotin-[acetyl-CoA-carboxylase] ligase
MKIVKLRTTTSTNSFLKEMVAKNTVDNFTVVTADYQTKGRGQRGNNWLSEEGKNLLISIFIRHTLLPIEQNFLLNQVISLAILRVLQNYLPQVKIKWPNDIMAGSYKIAGILIENTISDKHIKQSVIGIGLNVNQEIFPKEIPNVSSLKILLKRELNLDELLSSFVLSIRKNYQLLSDKNIEQIKQEYLDNLYLHKIESLFKNTDNQIFKGVITGVSDEGKLQLITDGTLKEFNFKELLFLPED